MSSLICKQVLNIPDSDLNFDGRQVHVSPMSRPMLTAVLSDKRPDSLGLFAGREENFDPFGVQEWI